MLKYKSPAASALPPPSVDGLLDAIWYLSVKLFTFAILLAVVLTLAMFVAVVFTLDIDPATVLILLALDTALLMFDALDTALLILLELPATEVTLD